MNPMHTAGAGRPIPPIRHTWIVRDRAVVRSDDVVLTPTVTWAPNLSLPTQRLRAARVLAATAAWVRLVDDGRQS